MGLAAWFFPHFGLWLALLVGAALAPTDAALGIPVVTNPVGAVADPPADHGRERPQRRHRHPGGHGRHRRCGRGGRSGGAQAPAAPPSQLLIGAARRRRPGRWAGGCCSWRAGAGLAAEDFAGIGVLALSLLAYTAALAVDGNGFVAAFCGGLAFGTCAGQRAPAELVFVEQMGGLVSLLVWLAFGAIVRSDHARRTSSP